jgi:hypothetical protein
MPVIICSKCTGQHHANTCTAYKQPRSTVTIQEDGEYACQVFIGTPDGKFCCLGGERFAVPANGLCLFSSLSDILPEINASELRASLMSLVIGNPYLRLKNVPLWQWISWDMYNTENSDVDAVLNTQQINALVHKYAQLILNGKWGGAIEIAMFAYYYKVNVHSYIALPAGGYQRMVMFIPFVFLLRDLVYGMCFGKSRNFPSDCSKICSTFI